MDNQQLSACNGESSQTISVRESTAQQSGKRCAYIYTLTDPRTKLIRYVGKTTQSIKRRLDAHISVALTGRERNYRSNWIKQLNTEGLVPIVELLDTIDFDDWAKVETYWISQLKTWGYQLTNMTEGGDGNTGGKQSEETKLKRSLKLKGRSRPPEVRAKISRGHTGKKLSDITKEKLRQANLGKKRSMKI